MIRMDLSLILTEILQAELARREKIPTKLEPLKRQKWVCKCGNAVFGGGDFRSVIVTAGRVWCRICCPGGRPNYYSENGRAASVPMEQKPA